MVDSFSIGNLYRLFVVQYYHAAITMAADGNVPLVVVDYKVSQLAVNHSLSRAEKAPNLAIVDGRHQPFTVFLLITNTAMCGPSFLHPGKGMIQHLFGLSQLVEHPLIPILTFWNNVVLSN